MMDIELVSVGLGIIATLIGVGWKIGIYLGDIKTSVVRIETLLAAQNARIDKIEQDVKVIEDDVKQIKKELHW